MAGFALDLAGVILYYVNRGEYTSEDELMAGLMLIALVVIQRVPAALLSLVCCYWKPRDRYIEHKLIAVHGKEYVKTDANGNLASGLKDSREGSAAVNLWIGM